MALITPLLEDGAVDGEALGRLLDLHAASGTVGVVLAGSTGEGALLCAEDLQALLRSAMAWRASSGAGLGIALCIGGIATTDCVENAGLAREWGSDGIMMAPPPYIRPSDEGLLRHYRAVSDAADLPMLVYNIPQRTACDIDLGLLARMVEEIPQIAGIKDSTPRAAALSRLRSEKGWRHFSILAGQDELTPDYMANGASGAVSVAANLQPQGWADYIDAALVRAPRAAALWDGLAPLCALLRELPNPPAVKCAAAAMGYCGGGLRQPLAPLPSRASCEFIGALREGGVLPPRPHAPAPRPGPTP